LLTAELTTQEAIEKSKNQEQAHDRRAVVTIQDNRISTIGR